MGRAKALIVWGTGSGVGKSLFAAGLLRHFKRLGLEAAPFKGGVPWEVLAWVQSFGPRVEVLSPPELRRLWLEEAERVLALYGNRQEVSGSPPKVRA